jgi:ABC-type transporter Mla subunit MlaD
VLQGSTALTERLSDAARAITSSSTALQAVVRDHAGTRDSLAAMLEQLRASVEHARRETSLSGDALHRIDAAAQALGRASVDVEAFLDRIGDVLERSHGAFASGVQKTVDGIYSDFYRKLSEATQLLTEGVAELAGALDRPGHRP